MKTPTRRACGLIALAALVATLSAAAGQDPKYPPPALTFVVVKDAKSQYRWRLQDKVGVVLAVAGKDYPAKQAARDSIEQLRKRAASDKVKYEFHQDDKMLHRWKLKGEKGHVLAVSGRGYQDKAAAEKQIAAIKAGAKEAVVVDKTD